MDRAIIHIFEFALGDMKWYSTVIRVLALWVIPDAR